MDRDTAKEMLARAAAFRERTEAVEAALDAGVPLRDIEAYLDWLDENDKTGSSRNAAFHGPSRPRSAISGR